MTSERVCPACGTTLSLDSLEGLCPKCVGLAVFRFDPHPSDPSGELESALAAVELAEESRRPNPEESGERIGNYILLEKLGEGGFGVVWVAEQERPVRRQVALKIIKLGMDTREVIARFEQERQALAMMNHPSIAKVFDAGATDWGRPFFVMELVRGARITDYCDEAKLSTADRLRLFIKVCEAVQHAHQKGIIHRDLKPSNILVTLQDGEPVPKVIDFGVAKATQSQRLTDLTVFTQFEQIIGTPLYMSPEQAELRGMDIDTRSDIYSLGVLLYELLTGRTPFDPEHLMKAGLDEIRRVIREQEPMKLSLFLKAMPADQCTTVAQRRHSDPVKLTHLLRGDLECIVMKALEKDRARRYETANGLARDIERHLANEPVLARPASHLYRLRRLARRNRVTFAASLAVLAALVIGLSVAMQSLFRERTARSGEQAQRQIAEENSARALASADAASKSELKARRSLYAADIYLVQQALAANNMGRARLLLDRHRPAPDQVDLRGWEWRYLWQQCRSGAQVMLTKREGIRVISLSCSPDGTLLVVGYFDGQVELWDIPKRRLLQVLQEPFDQRAHVAFSPRGDVLAATMGRGVVKLHNVVTGVATELCASRSYIRDLSFSKDGEWLSVLSAEPEVQVIPAAGGAPLMKYAPPKGTGMHFNNARISPDKQRLYVSFGAFLAPKVRCLSIPDGKLIWEIGDLPTTDSDVEEWKDIGFTAMDISPDGRTLALATGYSKPFVRLHDTESGKLVKRLQGHKGWVCELAFSTDGKRLGSASGDQTLRLWDTASWKTLDDPLRGHTQEVHAVSFDRAGILLASGSKEGTVLLWDLRTSRPDSGFRTLPAHISRLIPLPFGNSYLGGTRQGEWFLIDLHTLEAQPLPKSQISETGWPVFEPLFREERPQPVGGAWSGLRGILSTPSISANRKLIAVGSDSGHVALYEPGRQDPIDMLRGTMGSVFSVDFSPDGQRLAMSSGGGESVALWDVISRQELLTLGSPATLLYWVRWTADGNTLLVGSTEPKRNVTGTWQLWRAPSWEEINEAESIGGLWPQYADLRPAPAASTIGETIKLLEDGYRGRVERAKARSPKDTTAHREALNDMILFLSGQRRWAESQSFSRKLLHVLREETPLNEERVVAALRGMLKATFHLQTQSESSVAVDRSTDADALVLELLPLLAPLSARTPHDTLLALRTAALVFWFGRERDYQSICRRLIQLAEEKPPALEDARIADRAAKAVCMSPSNDPVLYTQVLGLVQNAGYQTSSNWERAWNHQSLGMAQYRVGNHAAAEEAFKIAEDCADRFAEHDRKYQVSLQALCRLFRSMISANRGKQDEAQGLFTAATAKMRPLPADERELLVDNSVNEDVIYRLIYREAKALLERPVPVAKD